MNVGLNDFMFHDLKKSSLARPFFQMKMDRSITSTADIINVNMVSNFLGTRGGAVASTRRSSRLSERG